MRKLALTLTAALVVGGCTSETDSVQDAVRVAAKSSALPPSSLSAEARRITSFASMPDRGTLLAFERLQQPVRRKAHTYHAVQLSEAHALKAAHPGGVIELPTPSGETLRITYQRHEESLDGNWTWIGRTLDGMDAIITFGEKAVFGRIAQPNTEALRLTMSGGRAWLVETDPGKLLDGNLLGDEDAIGMLVPSKTVQATLAGKRAKSVTTAGGEKASAAETVDVVLGYTNGFVTRYGNVSAATTRLTYLTALTNQAYQNSQVTGRVRLVHTLQVNYTDTNSNETALQALTGQTCNPTCSPSAVPAELVPLRTARDQYGGDLVSLVRPFQAPQHQGCGIAWLLGGGGFTIDNTDAPFGYSVVSDGNDDDETDGRNYFCRDETLAHELGHNMGQQHNTEDSRENPSDPNSPITQGTHPYSFGYREASSTGFYTIMAYRLSNSSQFAIPHFGNPSVNYSGRPTGTANADNARSLNLSIPLVAQFRATVVPFAGAANLMSISKMGASGRTEVHTLTYSSSYVTFSQNIATALTATGSDFAWEFLVGDYNNDGTKDLYAVSRMGTSGKTEVHVMNGSNSFQSFLLNTATALSQTGTTNNFVFRLADYNGDNKLDLYAIFRNGASGKTEVHVLNGADNFNTYLAHIATALGPTGSDGSWAFELADWNGDNKADLFAIYKMGGSNTTEVHVMNGATNFSTFILNVATGLGRTGTDYAWDFKVGDNNNDGIVDIFAIKRQGASTKLEVHVLDGQARYASFSAHMATALAALPSNNSWEFEIVN